MSEHEEERQIADIIYLPARIRESGISIERLREKLVKIYGEIPQY